MRERRKEDGDAQPSRSEAALSTVSAFRNTADRAFLQLRGGHAALWASNSYKTPAAATAHAGVPAKPPASSSEHQFAVSTRVLLGFLRHILFLCLRCCGFLLGYFFAILLGGFALKLQLETKKKKKITSGGLMV